MPIEIDISTKVYGLDDTVYRLFPGRGYRHFDVMKQSSVVFLDFPGIGLPGPEGYVRTDQQLDTLVRSEQKIGFVRETNDDLWLDIAVIDEADLGEIRWSRNREQSLEWMNLLYRDIQYGDLVVVPGPVLTKGEDEQWVDEITLIGEIVDDAFVLQQGAPEHILLGCYTARRVRWLAEIDEVDLPIDTRLVLRTPNPLITLRVGAFTNVIGAAHHNVIVGDEFHARFVTRRAEYSALDSYHFNAFVLAVVAVQERILAGEHQPLEDASIYELAARVDRQANLVPIQESSIRSPGYTVLRTTGNIAAVIAVLFQLGLQPEGHLFADVDLHALEFVNSLSDHFDPCEVGIDEAVRDTIDMLGHDRWYQMCRAATLANENDGLHSPSIGVRIEDEVGE